MVYRFRIARSCLRLGVSLLVFASGMIVLGTVATFVESDAALVQADQCRNKRGPTEFFRLLFVGPVVGIVVGTVPHFMYGYHEWLGWRGNLFVVGTLAGLGASAPILFMGIWLWWLEEPEPT